MRYTHHDGVPDSVLGRALSLLTCFESGESVLSVAELSRRSGVTKPTAHRLIVELETWGFVERSSDGVRLGMHLFELGHRVDRQRKLRDLALPSLVDLHQRTKSTVHLAVLEGLDVVYIEKLAASDAPTLPSRVGGRMPAYCTGVGKAMLAFSDPDTRRQLAASGLSRRTARTLTMPGIIDQELARIRHERLAFDREESTNGVACAACPVTNDDGVVAAISVSVRSTSLQISRVAPLLRAAAQQLADQLRAVPTGESAFS